MIKILTTIVLAIILLMIISYNDSCIALSDVTSSDYWSIWEPRIQSSSELIEKTGTIIGVISVIGIIVSVATLSVIGIKIMLGSVEEKASYKQKMVPWLIGATMVFAITTIPSLIYNITTSVIGDKGVGEGGTQEDYIIGFDEGVAWAKEKDETDWVETLRSRHINIFDMYYDISNRKWTKQYYEGYYDALTKCIDYVEEGYDSAWLYIGGTVEASNSLEDGRFTIDSLRNVVTGSRDKIWKDGFWHRVHLEIERRTYITLMGYDDGVDLAYKFIKSTIDTANAFSDDDCIKIIANNVEGKNSGDDSYKQGFDKGIEEVIRRIRDYSQSSALTYMEGWKDAVAKIKNGTTTNENIARRITDYEDTKEMYCEDNTDATEGEINSMENYFSGLIYRLKLQQKVWAGQEI